MLLSEVLLEYISLWEGLTGNELPGYGLQMEVSPGYVSPGYVLPGEVLADEALGDESLGTLSSMLGSWVSI